MDLDLLVIGSGPGGQRAAIQAAKLGKRVGVIERRDRIGGVSIHSGTIPSKTLRQAILEDLAGRGADLPDPLHPERQEHAAAHRAPRSGRRASSRRRRRSSASSSAATASVC